MINIEYSRNKSKTKISNKKVEDGALKHAEKNATRRGKRREIIV